MGDRSPGQPCAITDERGTDPVRYAVSCPTDGSSLYATITYGDFDYGFRKTLES